MDSQLPRPVTTLALFNEGSPQVVVGFYNYDTVSVEGAICAPNGFPANRQFIKACFKYVFEQLGCRRFVVRVDDSNTQARDFDLKLGFIHEGTLRQAAADGGDVLILGMLRDECRWLPKLGDRLSDKGSRIKREPGDVLGGRGRALSEATDGRSRVH